MGINDNAKMVMEEWKAAEYDAKVGNLRENCYLCSHSIDKNGTWCGKFKRDVAGAGWCRFYSRD